MDTANGLPELINSFPGLVNSICVILAGFVDAILAIRYKSELIKLCFGYETTWAWTNTLVSNRGK